MDSQFCNMYHCVYSRGLGLVGPLLGEDHPLNVPNAIAGIVYYTIMMFLSECICSVCVCVHVCACVCMCACVCLFVVSIHAHAFMYVVYVCVGGTIYIW